MWCGVEWWDGEGGILVLGARVVDEVSEGGGVIGIEGSHSLGEKAVEQSGGAGSDHSLWLIASVCSCFADRLLQSVPVCCTAVLLRGLRL